MHGVCACDKTENRIRRLSQRKFVTFTTSGGPCSFNMDLNDLRNKSSELRLVPKAPAMPGVTNYELRPKKPKENVEKKQIRKVNSVVIVSKIPIPVNRTLQSRKSEPNLRPSSLSGSQKPLGKELITRRRSSEDSGKQFDPNGHKMVKNFNSLDSIYIQ